MSTHADLINNLASLAKANGINPIELGLKANPLLASAATETWLSKFITEDETCLKIKQRVRLLSNLPDPVLIRGASGTGKEIIANALHGDRRGKFIAINCTSLPDYLMESELFGHAKGAFTGANTDKLGLFQAARDGTIFLDEIGDMPLHLQAKLLRVLQERRVRRVGNTNDEDINCRIIAATHQNPAEKLRQDLYYRLSTVIINLPPLLSRGDDIFKLATFFAKEEGLLKDIDLRAIIHQNPDELSRGNVRALINLIRQEEIELMIS